MINILEVKKQKEIDETFIFVGTVSESCTMIKVKAKTLDEAKDIMRKYAKKVGKKVNEDYSYMFNIGAISVIETLTSKDLED